MKKIIKIIALIMAFITAGGVIAGIKDLKEQKRREKQARTEGREIHKPYGPYEKYFKRPLDFILAATALLVLSPLMAVTAVLVKVKLGSPVLFSQKRPGKDEKIFTLWKYRSMTSERGADGELLPDEERLTGFGKALRSTSLDELPELFNILKGDMSVVGPRPQLVKDMVFMTDEQRKRHIVNPGLTGLAQVNGRNGISWEEKFEWDLEYIDEITFIGDLKIILQTVQKVLGRNESDEEIDVTLDYGDALLRDGKVTKVEYDEKQRIVRGLING